MVEPVIIVGYTFVTLITGVGAATALKKCYHWYKIPKNEPLILSSYELSSQ